MFSNHCSLQMTRHAMTQAQSPNEKEAEWLADRDWQDPVLPSLTSQKLRSIAEKIGEQLARTAVSINIKERRDFSCAIFSSQGDLLVNAPHVPVHLGAMSETIRQLLASGLQLSSGDVWLSNHPYFGGYYSWFHASSGKVSL